MACCNTWCAACEVPPVGGVARGGQQTRQEPCQPVYIDVAANRSQLHTNSVSPSVSCQAAMHTELPFVSRCPAALLSPTLDATQAAVGNLVGARLDVGLLPGGEDVPAAAVVLCNVASGLQPAPAQRWCCRSAAGPTSVSQAMLKAYRFCSGAAETRTHGLRLLLDTCDMTTTTDQPRPSAGIRQRTDSGVKWHLAASGEALHAAGCECARHCVSC